ncbi:hypothetical protein OIU34_16755 [Pararhizobium sp. BT-229]|uniref:hypothetical protein n=1 Tax=Pararhizobium sp. BT-229 TaxID=2986923 RepID=UPI0021F6E7BF|nr:hypothetical protein [Pararhizobium sp. BT-229]MCV9963555.1 hypothetical protein [Pararhizobium sp. BT-229]
MSANNTLRVVRLREFLVSEGWILDRRIEEDQGLLLLTHPDHARRQLTVPVDATRWDDWHEVCERAVSKVAEMTGRDPSAIWAIVDGPTRGSRLWKGLRSFAGSAVIASAATVLLLVAWDRMTAPAPVSITLAGCMDSEGAKAVTRMGYDIHVQHSGDDRMKNFAWTRWRALQAAANAEEMRKCYLEAQAYGHGFDDDGLIGEDMRRIEDGVKIVYSDIGASLVPGAAGTEEDRKKAKAAYLSAEAAVNRISIRLGHIVTKWYL